MNKQRPANIGLEIWRLKCFHEIFVQSSAAVILLNFCAENPPLRKALKLSQVEKIVCNSAFPEPPYTNRTE